MALSANQIIETKNPPARLTLKAVDGLLHIYAGAILGYESGNIGYVDKGSDTLTDEFAGIALEELNVSAADNAADGTYEVLVIARGSGELVKLTTTSTITIANEGDAVYMDGDDKVDISSGITNTTGGLVGIIRQFVDGNTAWVQLVQHPNV